MYDEAQASESLVGKFMHTTNPSIIRPARNKTTTLVCWCPFEVIMVCPSMVFWLSTIMTDSPINKV